MSSLLICRLLTVSIVRRADIYVNAVTSILIKLPQVSSSHILASTWKLSEPLCHREGQGKGKKKSTLVASQNHTSAWHLEPIHRFGQNLAWITLLDPRNKPANEFLMLLKIQDSCQLGPNVYQI